MMLLDLVQSLRVRLLVHVLGARSQPRMDLICLGRQRHLSGDHELVAEA